jgi:hypothetical protein
MSSEHTTAKRTPLRAAPLRPPAQARSLRGSERRDLEGSFGRDLGHVRVHEGPAAASSARAIDAAAYTVGHDIVLGPGAPSFSTHRGRHLLAHEVAHTLQQRPLGSAGGDVPLGARGTAFERSADGAADRVARGQAAAFQPASQIAPVIQRAEAGTYISKVGEKDYLDAAVNFFKFWGHPHIKRVSSMEDVVDDLATTKGHIDGFRIVSHGSDGRMELKTTNSLPADDFNSSQASLRTAKEFRELASDPEIINADLYANWMKVLLADPKTKPVLASLGITAAPAWSSMEGMFLRGLLEQRYLAAVQGPDDKPAKIKHRDAFEAFASLRRESYQGAMIEAADPKDRKTRQADIAKLIKEAPLALTRAGREAHLAKDEELDAGMLDVPAAGAAKIKPAVSALTKLGAGGSYVKKLAAIRERIDDKTHIDIRGCNVGADTAFLDNVRKLFGNEPKLPSVSAPDMYEYFYAIANAEFFGTNQTEKDRLTTDFGAVGKQFDARERMLKGEAMMAVHEKNLDEFAKKYGFDPLKIYLLNPELRADEKWHQISPPLVWLVARKIKAGTNRTFTEFAENVLQDATLADVLRVYNPHIKKLTIWGKTAGDTELHPNDDIWLSPEHLRKTTIWDQVLDPTQPKGGPKVPQPLRDRTSSPASTAADYETSLRGGNLFIYLDQGKVKIRLDVAHARSGFAKWLAARSYGPKPEKAGSIEKRLGKGMENVTNVYVDFLGKGYPAAMVEDPVFGDDPRFAKHIIRRP